jgi:hypothetical protein
MHSAGIVFGAERLNSLGSKHWDLFSRQDYFDARGVFFSAMVSGPLVLLMLIVLVGVEKGGVPSCVFIDAVVQII